MKLKAKKSKSGQTAVEYILIVGVIVGVIMLFGKNFKEKIGDVTGQLFGNISKGINDASNPR